MSQIILKSKEELIAFLSDLESGNRRDIETIIIEGNEAFIKKISQACTGLGAYKRNMSVAIAGTSAAFITVFATLATGGLFAIAGGAVALIGGAGGWIYSLEGYSNLPYSNEVLGLQKHNFFSISNTDENSITFKRGFSSITTMISNNS